MHTAYTYVQVGDRTCCYVHLKKIHMFCFISFRAACAQRYECNFIRRERDEEIKYREKCKIRRKNGSKRNANRDIARIHASNRVECAHAHVGAALRHTHTHTSPANVWVLSAHSAVNAMSLVAVIAAVAAIICDEKYESIYDRHL